MKKSSRTFQVFAKPAGYSCNLSCAYCYYLEKEQLFSDTKKPRMSLDILETYIKQHIEASNDPIITFSWHGGEPTLIGLDYFRSIISLQKKYQPANQQIANGIQTNGTLLTEAWCEFLSVENFVIGLSLDGPGEMHDRFRSPKGAGSNVAKVIKAYQRLKKYDVYCDILCVVNSHNVQHPLEVYRFFKDLKAPYITFLPLVELSKDGQAMVSSRSVSAPAFGDFLCTIFDEWKTSDIDKIKINVFEESVRVAFDQESALCVFRKTCGDIPVVEHNGDFFCCDHFVNDQHRLGNITQTPLVNLLESKQQKQFGQAKQDLLPGYCLKCDVLEMCHGGCPKDRILKTPLGEPGLNFLCQGYKQFFRHLRPFTEQLRKLWQQQAPSSRASLKENQVANTPSQKTGRNDLCPCGSGKKFKKCCLHK